jgi:DNA-binding CsgD family transcriptional regulator/tetratricopeptide (TPR) repeat protein
VQTPGGIEADRLPRRDDAGAGEGGGSFVGRASEMDVLLGGLADAISGRGRLFLLGGEPGIGKTRLADEFAARAQSQGARVLWGRCWEAGGAPAYWPWIQSIRGLLRDLDAQALAEAVAGGGADLAQMLPELRDRLPDLPPPAPASPEVARFRLFDAVSGFLARASLAQPLVVVLEDLHAADASSLLLLQFVAGELGGGRLLVLGTYRDVEVTRDHQLAAVLPEVARAAGSTRLPLSGLSEPDVARFIETITGREPPADLVAAIHRDTEGNPLFVEEVVRLLTSEGRLRRPQERQRWPIPEGVREVIGRRLERLPEACRRLLTLGSVVGRDFTVEVLERVTGRSAEDLLDTLHDAVAARLIGTVADDPGRFEFAHALVRDTLYEDLPPAEKVRLHRDVGQALEVLYAADPDPHVAELAHHFFEAAPAGDPSRGIDYAVAAGKRAVRLLAFEEAVRLFRTARRALRESPDERRRGEVLLLLGDAQGRSGATPDSKETFLEAAEIAMRLDLPELLAQAALGYGGRFQFQRAGIDRHVIPLLRQALEALGEADSVLRVRVLGRLAGALRDQPSLEPRATLGREAVAMARRIGDPDTLTFALIGLWGAALLGPDGVDESEVVADELDRLAEETTDRELRTNATWARFIALMTRGQVAEARAQQELVRRLSGELGQPPQQWYGGIMATILALQDGRFGDAERLIHQTLELGRRVQPWDAELTRMFGLFALWREQGRVGELEQDLRRGLVTHPGYRSLHCMILATLCDLGRLDEASVLFDQLAVDDFAAFPKDNEWLFALTLLAEAAAVLGERERAATLYDQLRPYADLVALAASEFSVGPVTRPLGILAALLGRRADAAAHFKDAIVRARRMGARPWVAHTQHAYAAMLAERGRPEDRDRAVELATAALETCEETAMPALADRVTGLLAELGAQPRRPRAAAQPGAPKGTTLTPREREVAGLVAEGLSNRQIADKLYLSERTAETHVQNILTKLGFRSRAQVAGWVVREGATELQARE